MQDCILNVSDLTTVQQGRVTDKNNCYLFQKLMTYISINGGQNEEFQMLQYMVQGLKSLNQLTVFSSPIEASPFILHMVTIITIII